MDLSVLLADALVDTTFRGGDGINTPEELRTAWDGATWGSPVHASALVSRPNVPDQLVNALVVGLRERLAPYLDASHDRVGHSFDVMGQGNSSTGFDADRVLQDQSTSSLAGLAHGLVRAAAVHGPCQTADMFDGWLRGEPLRTKICLVLGGAYVSDHVELNAGLALSPLPISSDGLPLLMPQMATNHIPTILGHPLLQIETSTNPVFFVPPDDDDEPFPQLQSMTALHPASVDVFMLALSLVSDRHVGVAWAWNDFGPAGSFATGRPGALIGPGPAELRVLGGSYSRSSATGLTSLRPFDAPAPDLSASRLSRARELLPYLQQRHSEDSRFRIAVTRWYESRSCSASLVDRAVDLRIALESLYLDSDSGELGFRLSTTAALFLGSYLAERRHIRKTLTDFYGISSRAIHGVDVDLTQGRNLRLLYQAGRLCRAGILKIVEQKGQPTWSDLLLGCG